MHTACILSIGTELTLGQTIDTNTAWLAARLCALGIRPVRHITIADERAAIRDALLEAVAVVDVVLVTGGLGPTADDLTREAAADAAGVPLELHAPSLECLRAFFADRNRAMPEANTVQAYLPRGATPLPNCCGTAPGILVELRGKPCFCLPGVPFEMQAMFARDVAPRLEAHACGAVLMSRRLHTFGLGESELGERMRDLMERGRNPEVGTTAEYGIVGIRINAAGPLPAAAVALCDAAEAEIRQRLGTLVYGRNGETLAQAVSVLLLQTGQTLATAESCTGGLVGALLTDVAGSSRYYLGGAITYANAAKEKLLGVPGALLAEHGAVSAPVAAAMAEGVSRSLGSDYGIAITGIAGPTGGSAGKPVGLVYIALRVPTPTGGATRTQESRFGSDAPRDAIRLRAARTALNLLRLHLLDVASATTSQSR